jgi:hypothetical protein
MVKIVGIVQCKNEWGLLAVSISHALMSYASEVYVLDHASDDQSASGLSCLKDLWGDRLHVLHVGNIPFDQAAMINTAIHLMDSSQPTWVHVFDADEFLLVEDGFSLAGELDALPTDVLFLNYPVENHVSTLGFNENRLPDYAGLRYKSEPFEPAIGHLAAEKIASGAATFFDYPFPSKVLFKYAEGLRLWDGAHGVTFLGHGLGQRIPHVAAAHLVFATRARLEGKAQQGAELVALGKKPHHGWQNQLLHRLRSNNQLDAFWRQHAIDERQPLGSSSIRMRISNALPDSLRKTIDVLTRHFESEDLGQFCGAELAFGRAPESQLGLGQVIALAGLLLRRSVALETAIQKRSVNSQAPGPASP